MVPRQHVDSVAYGSSTGVSGEAEDEASSKVPEPLEVIKAIGRMIAQGEQAYPKLPEVVARWKQEVNRRVLLIAGSAPQATAQTFASSPGESKGPASISAAIVVGASGTK